MCNWSFVVRLAPVPPILVSDDINFSFLTLTTQWITQVSAIGEEFLVQSYSWSTSATKKDKPSSNFTIKDWGLLWIQAHADGQSVWLSSVIYSNTLSAAAKVRKPLILEEFGTFGLRESFKLWIIETLFNSPSRYRKQDRDIPRVGWVGFEDQTCVSIRYFYSDFP
jgi:hypothetical protein